ncbi:hypothetical protein MSG28_006339, partial [Choristoneura fumiferana]
MDVSPRTDSRARYAAPAHPTDVTPQMLKAGCMLLSRCTRVFSVVVCPNTAKNSSSNANIGFIVTANKCKREVIHTVTWMR